MNNTRYKRPDKKNAQSIIETAKREMRFTLSLDVKEESATTIIKNVYECFRMLGDALLVSKGMPTDDHVSSIRALLKIKISSARPIALLDNYRILRHNLSYYGYLPNIKEAEDIIDFAKGCFEPALKAVEKEIN